MLNNIGKCLVVLGLAISPVGCVGDSPDNPPDNGYLVSPDGGARLEYHSSPNDIELTLFDMLCDGRDAYMEFEVDDSGRIWEWGLYEDDTCDTDIYIQSTYIPVIDSNIREKISFSVCTRGEIDPDNCSDWFTAYI